MAKKVLFTTFLIITFFCSNAQFYKSLVPSPEFNNALEKVVSDFRYNFKNISGDTLVGYGDTETFKSTIKLPGAIECLIYKFHSVKDTTASWQAVMYDGDDQKEAIRIYKNTFRLVNKSRLQLIDKSIITFAGKLQEPTDDVRFAISSLQLDIPDVRYTNFRGEVELVSTFDGWKVNLNLHNIKLDEDRD